MTAYVYPFLRTLFDRARRAALFQVLGLLIGGVTLCLVWHVLPLSTVAEACLNGGVALALAVKGLKL